MRNSQLRNVLVYRLSALGDVAMTIPAVYSCARAWPDVTFHVVTSAFCAQLYVNAPRNIVLHQVDKPVSTRRVLEMVSGIKVDAVADLHNVLRSWIVDTYYIIRGRKVAMLNKHRGERQLVITHCIQAQPYTERYFDVFRRLGLDCQPAFTSLYEVLPPLPLNIEKRQERWVGIAPYARYINKVYPLDMMQRVVSLLADTPNVRIFLFGSKGEEADALNYWQQMSPCIHNVAGQFTLQEELSLMARLDVMLSMDSANQHMASLVGTRVVTVWGSTTSACGFTRWGHSPEDALCANIDCQPCTTAGSNHCRQGNMACMIALNPETLVSRLLKR